MNLRRLDRLSIRTIRYEFSVSGEGIFPFDMLRQDRCYPATTDDVASIGSNLSGRRTIRLVSHTRERDWHPSQSKWKHLGWRVE